MKTSTAGLALWLLIGGLAAGAVFWQWRYPPRLQTLAQATPGAIPPLALPATPPLLPLPPLEHYSDIITHPLFIASRQPEPPPENAPAEKPPVGPEPMPTLLGILIMPQATVALLRPEQPGAKTVRLRVGEMVGEWRLDAVFPHRVVLSKGGTSQELALVRPKPPAGSRPGKRSGAKPPPVAPPGPAPVAPPPNPL